jgi:hypothetical protein
VLAPLPAGERLSWAAAVTSARRAPLDVLVYRRREVDCAGFAEGSFLHVHALGQLARMADTAQPAQAAQAREVAVRGLRSAADELVRIAPDDPVASGILAGYDRARASAPARPDSTAQRKVVWF